MANHSGKDIDITVYGATGFTGQLVAEYLAHTYPASSGVRWAMAGRDADKLARVREAVHAPADTPLLVADSSDRTALEAIAKQSKVVLSTVGPYQLYGNDLVAVCAETGTDYVDLCGEPAWMAEKIEQHSETAKASGARIVFSCGFDSIPFEMGVHFLQQEAKKSLGAACTNVAGRVLKMQGASSGGTVASFRATMAAIMENPALMDVMKNPFALAEGFQGPKQPSSSKPRQDDAMSGLWIAPFFMAPINTKNVHRSNLLLGHAYGEDFTYNEMVVAGPGEKGQQTAEKIAASGGGMTSKSAPKPGEGPSREEREAGHYEVLFIGQTADGQTLQAGVQGDRDPGYGSTSKMISEAALCLVQDRTDTPGGIWTPAPAMGEALIDRLQANAGLTFDVR